MAHNVRDVRKTRLWQELEEHFHQLHAPAFGKPFSAAEIDAAPNGDQVVFTGGTWEKLAGIPNSNIYIASVKTGQIRALTSGSQQARCPKWSPDGKVIAFLSDRVQKGRSQLYLLHGEFGEAQPAAAIDGTIEYISWSPKGTEILMGVAGDGAEKAGAQGSGGIGVRPEESIPEWMPDVEGEAKPDTYRSLWIYDTVKAELRRVSRVGSNVWEATWCGPSQVAAIVSDQPGEGAWYDAPLVLIPTETDGKPSTERIVYRGRRQLAVPAASRSGALLAVLEGVCSDRGIMAGDVLLIDASQGTASKLDTSGVDTTQLHWRDEEQLFYIGLRGLQTVAGNITVHENKARTLWDTSETCGSYYPDASVLPGDSFAVIGESWTRYPEIGIVDIGDYRTIATLDHKGGAWLRSKLGPIEGVRWTAPDGLEIEGLLALPNTGSKPYPLVLYVHGGPVWAFRNRWQIGDSHTALLVSRGYAMLFPNPRGSSGRGQDFAERVFGDMGGLDTNDFLSGIDALITRGIIDPKRLGVCGRSYGGYMSTWLVTQTTRFAASVPIAPVSDWISMHTTCNIPEFCSLFLDGKPYALDGLYIQRSPLHFASRCKTPTLHICGSDDRCTPPTQALQFHCALVEHGTKSVFVQYPGEGHGVRKFPAYIDFCYRLVSWMEEHMPAK
ncbi:hypothetical protein NQ176_g2838 [Zarea fungicola]|uniref:Uncharacterized protein n=1 Tax=Zarea fungicola TaxID=93591 RepID=A0ACC1NMR4_9HYPO|nr:hypothetical protein NQ176_g2838 [Lecanicillium fungicola]